MLTGHTRVAAVIGDPVRHSLSPIIHNAAFAARQLDWVYVAFPVRDGEVSSAIAAMRALDLGGLSVTMPHKTAIAAAVDELTPAARELSAVNCVFRRGECLVGDNTDGAGFVDGLARDAGRDVVAGARCAVLGAGGAGRAVVRALAGAGAADIAVINRDPARAAAAAALGGAAGRVGTTDDIEGARLVVNATPRGMAGPAAGELPCAPEAVAPGAVAVDLVYHPSVTPWLDGLSARGIEAHNGLSMLVFQAGHAFAHWTGEAPPIDAMVGAVARFLRNPGRET